jgi:phosphatidate phosphatase APP1
MRRSHVIGLTVVMLAAVAVAVSVWSAEDSPADEQQVKSSKVRNDERIIFFPTAAFLTEDGKHWTMPIHGWIFEPEEDGLARKALVATLASIIDLDDQPAEQQRIFRQRIGRFLVDNERGKRIAVRCGRQVVVMDSSGADGHFSGEMTLSIEEAGRLSDSDKLTFTAITHNDDGRKFIGEALLIGPRGISVISDIDDTIKVTEVTDHKAMLRRTFIEPFEPAPGMAELYRQWAAAGTTDAVGFHYVSSSPWQLYEPLAEMMRKEGFPAATFDLKQVRVGPGGLMKMLADPLQTKPKAIRKILEAFPQRSFILVGDSGEKDPQVYGQIAREYPNQIIRILIRDVTDTPADDPRYKKAFENIPAELWEVFKDPAKVAVTIP